MKTSVATKPSTKLTDAQQEALVIERFRVLKLAHWTDSAVPCAQDVYDDALEAFMDTVNECLDAK